MTGTITGTVANAMGSDYMTRESSFNVTCFGAVQFSGAVAYVVEDDVSKAFWTITAEAGSDSMTQHSTTNLIPLGGPPPPFDISGTMTATVDVEEWVDFGVESSENTSGVFLCPPQATLHLYEQYVEGASVTASMTSGGVTVTASAPMTGEVSYDLTITANAATGLLPAGYPNSYSEAQDFSLVCDFNGLNVLGGLSTTCSGGTASNFHGAEIHLTGAPPSPTAHSSTGTVNTQVSLPKSFRLVGAIKSVSDPYPGSVDIFCPLTAVDPMPTVARSDGWSVASTQREDSGSVSIQSNGVTLGSDSVPHHEYADLTPEVDSSWCIANGEYVTYADSGGTVETLADSAVYLHGYLFDGLSLSQASSITVDDCTSTEDWTGAALASGGGLVSLVPAEGDPVAPMVRSWADGFDFSGYRYLRLHDASVGSGTATVTLALGTKTWTATLTETPTDIDFDLCDPVGGPDVDTVDTKWPLDATARNVSDGPLRGVSTMDSLSLSVPSGASLTVEGISQVRYLDSTAHFLSGHAPRMGTDTPEETPSVSSGTDGSATGYAHRGLLCLTDSKPSLEYADQYALHDETGPSVWEPTYWPISDLVARVNSGDAERVGVVGRPVLSSGSLGWTATALAHADDSSENLNYGLLNADCEGSASWLCYGWHYLGGDIGWGHTLDQDAASGASIKCQVMFTTLQWYPGCGDAFHLAPTGADTSDGAIWLAASKVYRAQAVPLLLDQSGGDVSGIALLLTPGPGELQATTDTVGTGATGAEGSCRTTGTGLSDPGLIGYTGGDASQGVVAVQGTTAARAFRTRRLSWLARRVPKSSCCDLLFFQDPALYDPIPALPGDADAMPVEEWKRA